MLGVIVLIIVIVLLWIITTYNAFIQIEKQVQNSWAQIDVQLKRQADLIPNLVETVKGYAKFEKKVLTDVTKARTAIMSAKTPAQAARGENMLSGALKSIFAVAESYPRLQASENFKALQEELSSTANKVAFARQFYNDMVMKWNTLILQFPSNVLANMFGKNKEKESFEASASERKNTKVDFSDLS
ncbi:MAG: LemA family protein [Candidatus Diapherotrites archaeon]|nr:LemA family protein [Candidatus Diapherotrites archaeon]